MYIKKYISLIFIILFVLFQGRSLCQVDDVRLGIVKPEIEKLDEAAMPQDKAMRPSMEIKYLAGKDGVWFNQDDDVYLYYKVEYDTEGKMIKKESYKCGKDGIPFTNDDELQEYYLYVYSSDGSIEKEVLHKVIEGRDISENGSLYEHNSDGLNDKIIKYDETDNITSYTSYQFDDYGKVIQDVEYLGAGKDQVWFTGDDEIEKYHKRQYNEDGKLISATEYHHKLNGPGEDKVWFTADDVVSSVRAFTYDKSGIVKKTLKMVNPGPDNKWFSSDDEMQYYTVREYILMIRH